MNKFLTSIAAIAVSTTGAFASDLSSMSWDEIVAQAKEEGSVTFTNWYLQDAMRDAMKPFEEKYGIKVTIPEGKMTANRDKLLAEANREKGDFDVFAFGFNDFEVLDKESLFLTLDALPKDDGRKTKLAGIDGGKFVVAYWGNQTGISYDPAKVAEADLPQTPAEFEAFWTANPGKFGFNYEKGGSGPSFFHNVLRVVGDVDLSNGDDSAERVAELQAGIDFFNKNAENYVITASNADSITRVSDGELWMAPGWEDHVAGLQKRGEIRKDIKFYVPSFGMNGGGNGVAIPKNSQHPAAALVFINWLTSAETQTSFNANFGTAPMHANADDSNALVPNDQRAYTQPWGAQPLFDKINETFIENVIQER
jgi:putative spermidine/putrescine transport system substrate-binding protein